MSVKQLMRIKMLNAKFSLKKDSAKEKDLILFTTMKVRFLESLSS